MKNFLWIVCLFFVLGAYGQSAQKTIHVIAGDSKSPISGATVYTQAKQPLGITDDNGNFRWSSLLQGDSLVVTAIGFEPQKLAVASLGRYTVINMVPSETMLREVVITASNLNPYHAISQTDIKLRAVSNSQEVLRIVPGLFIGQHQGGGKAEQIFLRGFDNDHGTDINLSVDGLPINIVSHAHGQGYADSHFIIPETIESTHYEKGMYNAAKGDMSVTGFAEFQTTNAIDKDIVKLEGGQFSTFRALAMSNLLPRAVRKDHSWYTASEYRYSDGFFDHSQHFKRLNFFTKYSGRLNAASSLTISASSMHSSWSASGQIPDIAVQQGLIGFYGAIDPNEGGTTSRANVNIQLETNLPGGSLLKNQLYYSHYNFDLSSNFTLFLNDTVNGDQIRQKESRDLIGYNGSYSKQNDWGNMSVSSTLGWNGRLDLVRDISLAHTVDRYKVIDPVKLGNITEAQGAVYLEERFTFSPQWAFDVGARFDYFHYMYDNRLPSDSAFDRTGKHYAHNGTVSPKLKLSYAAGPKTQLYLFAGKGFHSNDARGAVVGRLKETLPSAYGTDLGIVAKPAGNLVVNAALWYNYLQKEYVYGGDGGSVEFSGRTQRVGMDLSLRYQFRDFLYLDYDLNYAHGRAAPDPRGSNYIPLAPVWSSSGGITWILKNGVNGSFRYRYLGDRPANEDYSLTAQGYFVTDFVLNYTAKKFELGLSVNNLFNVKWKETQFDTYFRLRGQQPVDGIAFTAGTKFTGLAHFSYFF